ncbi:hypothetical protein QLX08_004009 [Tetragonisca angustula]|uniref:ENT domain-containing protein n=1 Tax=Tetragonisca angustula TaxID=166442 RepID=A0AAW1A5M3_9HYME
MWPVKRETLTRDQCKRCLRCLELEAYGNMVSVLRAQGPLTTDKQKLLRQLAKVLHVSNERHRAEVRRAVNDEKLATIAEQLNGPNAATRWTVEGRRPVPLLPRLNARSAFATLANSLSLATVAANERTEVDDAVSRKRKLSSSPSSSVQGSLENALRRNVTLMPFHLRSEENVTGASLAKPRANDVPDDSSNSRRPVTTVSNGPGPPRPRQTTTAETDVAPLNSSKTRRSDTKLASVIVIKGRTKGVALSPTGKQVIMGGKSLCVDAVPRRVAFRNGDQPLTISSATNSSPTSDVKSGDTLVFDLPRDMLEKDEAFSRLLTSESDTVLPTTDRLSKRPSNSDLNTRGKVVKTDDEKHGSV